MPNERKQVSDKIRAAIKAHGGTSRKTMGGRFGTAGDPDIIGCLNGVTLAIECKAKGKLRTLTPIQARRLEEWGGAGAVAFVTDTPHVGDILNLMALGVRVEKRALELAGCVPWQDAVEFTKKGKA